MQNWDNICLEIAKKDVKMAKMIKNLYSKVTTCKQDFETPGENKKVSFRLLIILLDEKSIKMKCLKLTVLSTKRDKWTRNWEKYSK